jgi:hypothetical protein
MHVAKKGTHMNAMEKFHIYNIYSISERVLQLNDTFTDTHNLIWHYHIHVNENTAPHTIHFVTNYHRSEYAGISSDSYFRYSIIHSKTQFTHYRTKLGSVWPRQTHTSPSISYIAWTTTSSKEAILFWRCSDIFLPVGNTGQTQEPPSTYALMT